MDSLDDLPTVARQLFAFADDLRVWCFEGEIGAGKTTLIQAICTELGVHQNVVSPTFSLVNEYSYDPNGVAYHMDLYRLEQTEEAVHIGIEEYFFSGNYCFIEWPEVARGLLPEAYLTVKVEIDAETRRKVLLLKD